ncbi:3'-5' exonuclease [Diaporthe helianthi]|uniref:3'-5' exonuclease n=1 Tax=Diaporthe helianthi TaxID=158607 RepID=A0A2P5IA84_DIAHE|nr:3'-5' exonuclease [Diaporthe helianthi]
MHSNKFPPKWRLWHPNQGIVFQQPLYPVLDVARFFTEASAVNDTGVGSTGLGQEATASCFNSDVNYNSDLSDNSTGSEVYQTPLAGTPTATANQNPLSNPPGEHEPESNKEEEIQPETADALPSSPPFTPLDYKIPEEIFSAAVNAAEGTSESFWSYAMYRGPNDEEDGMENMKKVSVHYCKSAHVAERVCRDYFLGEKVIGFDLEWSMDGYKTTSARKNVSLVQLASQSRVALIHVAAFPIKDELVPPTLKSIMEDPEITKTGVWIKGDCTRLQKYLGIESRGIFELSHLFRQVKYTKNGRHDLINKRLVRLADQVQETMHLPLFKGPDVRTSDWSKPLNMDQIVYSASDAYAAVQLYAMLNHQREELDPMPPMPFHAEKNKPIPLAPGYEGSSSDEAESAEDEEEDMTDAEYTGYMLRLEQLRALAESIRAEAGEEDGDNNARTEVPKPAKSKSRSSAAPKKPPPPPKDPRIIAAEAWLMEYKATRPGGKTKAGGAALRAYFIWHGNDDLSLDDIAKLLRDPPLQVVTVSSYILEAVKAERLVYDKARLRQVLDLYPPDVAQMRYGQLLRATANVSRPLSD